MYVYIHIFVLMYNASKLAYKHGTESVGKKQGLDVRTTRNYVTPETATPDRRKRGKYTPARGGKV